MMQSLAEHPRSRRLYASVAVGLLIFAAIALSGVVGFRTSQPLAPAAATPGPAASSATATVPVAPPSAPSLTPSATADANATPSATPAPRSTRPAMAGPAGRPHPTPAQSPPGTASEAAPAKTAEPAKKNCDPPYVLSADGIKTYKPECY
jgi:hypothetical protein